MTSAKDIFVAPVSAKDANDIVKKVHYSGSVVQNSTLHLGTQCGDGTIYRASGFSLIGIKQNKTILEFPNGQTVTDLSLKLSKPHQLRLLGGYYSGTDALRKARELGAKPKVGFQLRYIYFLNKEAKGRLTVPILPFSRIDEIGATMYKGIAKRSKEHESEHPSDVDGATPI